MGENDRARRGWTVNLLALLKLQSAQAVSKRPGEFRRALWEKGKRNQGGGMMWRVNKVDCLMGCRLMNFGHIHSLRGHAGFLSTCD